MRRNSSLNDNNGCVVMQELEVDPDECRKLPIVLLTFNVKAIEEGNELNWATAIEFETSHFSLICFV